MNNNSSSWNGSREAKKPTRPPKKPTAFRGIFAGLITMALVGLALWFVLFSKPDDVKVQAERKKTIPTVQTGKSSKATKVESASTRSNENLPIHKPSGKRIDKRENIVEPQSLEEMESAMTNKVVKEERYVPFKNGAEQLIALATPSSPGAPVPPLPMITDEGVAKDVEAAMDHIITVHEKDTDAILDKKIVVADAKEEFRELREKEGWTFTEYLNALRDKANADSEFLAEANRMCNEIYHDASVSDEDYIKYRDQLNEKLRERGLPEIEKEEEE